MQTAEVVAFAKAIKFIKEIGIKNIEKHGKPNSRVWIRKIEKK